MRHQVFGKKLGRDTNARKALLDNLASALIVSGKINTTLTKAKFARAYIEKLITSASKNRLSKNRILASRLSQDALQRLLKEIGPGFTNRSGGYTRIIKTGQRLGDGAPMARLELLPIEKKQKPATSPRTDSGAGQAVNTEAKSEKTEKSVKDNLQTVSPVVAKNQRKSVEKSA